MTTDQPNVNHPTSSDGNTTSDIAPDRYGKKMTAVKASRVENDLQDGITAVDDSGASDTLSHVSTDTSSRPSSAYFGRPIAMDIDSGMASQPTQKRAKPGSRTTSPKSQASKTSVTYTPPSTQAQLGSTSMEVIHPEEPADIVVEDFNANDSALGDDVSTYSASVTSSVYNHVYENGRRYHSYYEGAYLNPDDEEEQERLDLQHHIWKMIQGGKLYTAPLNDPAEILDLGTGTGIWVVEMAEEFPKAQITGTDISPIQPVWVPTNCLFYIDNFEQPWVFKKEFDYIHGRVLGGAVSDFAKFHQEAFIYLKPGGWLEMQDFESYIFCDDDTYKPDSWMADWISNMNKGSVKFGKAFNAIADETKYMEAAGFVNIRSQVIKIPVGTWAKDQKLKDLGQFMLIQLFKAVDSMTPAMYTRILGFTLEETQVQMEMIKRELANRKIHKYVTYHFVCGQKPER